MHNKFINQPLMSDLLYGAIKDDNYKDIRKYSKKLSQKGLLNKILNNQYGFLHYAAMLGKIRAVEILIGQRVDITLKDGFGFTAMHIAACNDSVESIAILKLLLTPQNVSICADQANLSIFHVAAYHQAKDVLAFLLTKYPQHVNIADVYGRTPLFLAVEAHKSVEIVNFLLKFGAATEVRSTYDKSLKDMANENEALNALFQKYEAARQASEELTRSDDNSYTPMCKLHTMPKGYWYSTEANPLANNTTKKTVRWSLAIESTTDSSEPPILDDRKSTPEFR